MKRCVAKVTKSSRFFGAILRQFGTGRQKFAGACHVTGVALCFPVKFRPNRFRFGGVIPEKVILYDHSRCLRHIIIIPYIGCATRSEVKVTQGNDPNNRMNTISS